MSQHRGRYYDIPDVRDGLTEVERAVLFVMYEARKEYGNRMIPAALLYGRVVEILDMSWEEFSRALDKTGGRSTQGSLWDDSNSPV